MKPNQHLRQRSLFASTFVLSFLFFTLSFLPLQAADNCFDLVNSFLESDQARVAIPEGSIVEQTPAVLPLMERMIPENPDFPKFIFEFQQLNQRTPTLRETIEYVYEGRRELHQAYDELAELLTNLNHPHQQDFLREIEQTRNKLAKFKNLDSLEDEVHANFTEGKSTVESLDIPIPIRDENGQTFFDEDYYRFLKDRTGLSNYSGEIGELLVYAKTPERILAKGLRFDMNEGQVLDAYQTEIMQRVSLLRENLQTKNLDQLKAIINQYTTPRGGFLRHAQEFIDENEAAEVNPADVVDKIMNMVTSKEIDLVSVSAENKIVWTEVKAYGQQLSAQSIAGNGPKKSIIDQLQEHKALRDILGLEHQVDLRFSSPLSGMDNEAKEMVESLGFKVF